MLALRAAGGALEVKPLHAFLVGLVVLLPAIFVRDLWAPDEPRHAEVARTMLVTGEYLVPHLNGEVYSDKPAPAFWLIAASMRILGSHDEWAARVPFVLAAAGTLAVVAALCIALGVPGSALLAVLFLLTAGRYAFLAQRVSLDVTSTFFVTLSLLAWVRQQRGRGSDLGNGLLFFGAAAAGVLAKGPLGLLVPLFTALAHGFATGTIARFGKPRFLFGIALMLVTLAAWIVPACLAAGSTYSQDLLIEQGPKRVFAAWNHANPPWYYVPKVVLEFLPWSPLAVIGLWLLARKRHPVERDTGRFLLAWFWPTFVFLSLVEAKRGNYLLPLYPGLAILAAVTLDGLLQRAGAARDERVPRVLSRTASATACVFIVAGVAASAAPFVPVVADLGLRGIVPRALCAGAVLLAVGGGAFAVARTGARAGFVALAGGLAAALPLLALLAYPLVDQRKSERPIAEVLRARAVPTAPYVPMLDVRAEGIRFYSGLDCREVDEHDDFLASLARPDVTLAVAERDELEEIGARLPDAFVEVASRAVSRRKEVVVLQRIERREDAPGRAAPPAGSHE